MTGITWEQRLDGAKSAEEVLAAARDFLARFEPHEINALPEKCRPPARLVDSDDVGRYAYDLVRNECDDRDAAEIVHRLAHFFSHASMQLARIVALERASRALELEGVDEGTAASSGINARRER